MCVTKYLLIFFNHLKTIAGQIWPIGCSFPTLALKFQRPPCPRLLFEEDTFVRVHQSSMGQKSHVLLVLLALVTGILLCQKLFIISPNHSCVSAWVTYSFPLSFKREQCSSHHEMPISVSVWGLPFHPALHFLCPAALNNKQEG